MSFWADYNCNRYDPDSHENRIVCDSEYVTEKELSDAKDLIIETTKEYADEYTVDQAKEHAEALQTAYEQSMNDRATTFESGINTRVTAVENAETAHEATVTAELNGFESRVTATESVSGTASTDAANAVATANDAKKIAELNDARLDTAISGVTQDNEVEDIRVGANGNTYDTAGNAVRGQITDCNNDIKQFVNPYVYKFNATNWQIGKRGSYHGNISSATNRVTHIVAPLTFKKKVTISFSGNVQRYIYKSSGSNLGWSQNSYTTEDGVEIAIVLRYSDDRDITSVSDILNYVTFTDEVYERGIEIDETIEKVKTLPNFNEYNGKKISILGDSISTFAGYSYPGNRTRYPQSGLLTDVNDTYWMRIIKEFKLELGISETWAGSMVSNTQETDSGDKGPNRCMASQTRINHLGENGVPDIILVNGGTNDIHAVSNVGTFNTESPLNYTDEQIASLPVATFADAYRTMLIRLQKTYPNSTIICLLPNYTTTYYTPTKADTYCEVIKEACDYFGVKWVDMRTSGITMFNRDTYLPDGIHPNALGMKMMSKNVGKKLNYDFTI